MQHSIKTFSAILILPVMLLNLTFVGSSVCQSMPGMEKMSCCNPAPTSCELPGAQLEKASCGCAMTKSTQANANVIGSSETFRVGSKELYKTFVAVVSFDQIEVDTRLFFSASFDLYQQPKFLNSQKIYVFVSSYLI
ncbi:MAG TPA: hypothetical protein VGA99_12400 [bacterium]